MKIINSTDWLSTGFDVDWIDQKDEGNFTEFVYKCKCGKTHFDVYFNNGKSPVSRKHKICYSCKRNNVVPCLRIYS